MALCRLPCRNCGSPAVSGGVSMGSRSNRLSFPDKTLHRFAHVLQNRDPFLKVLFPVRGEDVQSPRRPAALNVPFGTHATVLFKLAERSVNSGNLNRGVGQCVFVQIADEFVPVTPTLPLQKKKQYRFHKPVEISHCARARVLRAVPRTGALRHVVFVPLPTAYHPCHYRCKLHLDVSMAVCATFGGPRMGPIFGGMLLSGRRVAELILEKR